MEKLNLPSLKFTFDTGLALPLDDTKYPTNVLSPECLTSSQAGFSLPSSLNVMFQRPSIVVAKKGKELFPLALKKGKAIIKKINEKRRNAAQLNFFIFVSIKIKIINIPELKKRYPETAKMK
jgi:hypothetical protein